MSQDGLKVNYCGIRWGGGGKTPFISRQVNKTLDEVWVSSFTVKWCIGKWKYQLQQITNHL